MQWPASSSSSTPFDLTLRHDGRRANGFKFLNLQFHTLRFDLATRARAIHAGQAASSSSTPFDLTLRQVSHTRSNSDTLSRTSRALRPASPPASRE